MKLGFVGCGKMAEAIMAGLLDAGIVGKQEIVASDVDRGRRRKLEKSLGIRTVASNQAVAEQSGIVVLAVKPQNLPGVLFELSGIVTRRHLAISIAAGVTTSRIESALPRARIIRVMPNLACLVSASMSAVAPGRAATPADRRLVAKLFGALGDVVELPEGKFDAVTALSGSGPAFLTYCLEQMLKGASKAGLPRGPALRLARQTMLGTGKLLVDCRIDPRDLIMQVASAKGTTAAGLAVLDKSGIGRTLERAILAAAQRSKELSGEFRCRPPKKSPES